MPASSLRKYLVPLRRLMAGAVLFTAGTAMAESNTHLLEDARQNVDSILNENPGPHAFDMKRLNARGAPYLVFDQDRYDAGMALGLQPVESARRTLAAEGYADPAADTLRILVQKLSGKAGYSPLGLSGDAIEPAAVLTADGPCIAVHAFENAALPWDTMSVHGLNDTEIRAFLNGREEKYCKGDPGLTIPQDLPAISVMEYAEGKKQAWADAAQLIEMDPADIDRIAEWRAAKVEDHRHYSTPVLFKLEASIDKMGLAAARANGPQVCRAAADATVRPELFGMLLKFHKRKAKILKATNGSMFLPSQTENVDPQRGQDLDQLAADSGLARRTRQAFPADDASKAAFRQAKNWNALAALNDRAFKDSGEVTPVADLRAYNALQTEFRRRMKAEPANLLWQEEAMKLRSAFVGALQTVDFTGETARRQALSR